MNRQIAEPGSLPRFTHLSEATAYALQRIESEDSPYPVFVQMPFGPIMISPEGQVREAQFIQPGVTPYVVGT